MGAINVEKWDIAFVIVQNVKILVGPDHNPLFKGQGRQESPWAQVEAKDKQRAPDQAEVDRNPKDNNHLDRRECLL